MKQESRLIASTMTQRIFTLDRAIDELKKHGFDKMELCTAGDWIPHFDVVNANPAMVQSVAEMIQSKEMNVHCMNVSGNYTIGQMESVYALAAQTGAGIVTFCCGMPEEGRDNSELIKERAEFNSRLCDLADKYGVICSIEAPHKLSLAESAEQIDAYWALQDERVRCTYDIAHLIYADEDIYAIASKYMDRIAHAHLRDAVKGNSLLRYGQGSIDFKAYLEFMKKSGYTGYYSMEYPVDSEEEASQRIVESVNYLSQFGI